MKRILAGVAVFTVLVASIALAAGLYVEHQDRVEQRFLDLFPEWRASNTACMTPSEELDFIRQYAPSVAARIDSANAEFEALAAREAVGTLTVSEREAYLDHNLRVPHLVQTGSEWYDWTVVDPRTTFFRHESEGPLVRQCPADNHSHGWNINSCFGYVNIDLRFLGQEFYRNLEQSGETRDFVLHMMDYQSDQAAFRRQAERIVADLPASEVSAASVEWRVRAEYERLRCSQ